MALKFAGIELPHTTPKAEEMLERSCSLSDIWEWQMQFWPGARQPFLTVPGIFGSKQPSFRLQRLWWPRGASQWSHIHFLVTDDRLDQIRTAYASGPATLEMTWVDENGGIVDTLSTDMYMLTPRPLATIATAPIKNLRLLTLVDQRYYWWLTTTGDLTLVEYYPATASTTWDDLYTQLGTALGTAITHDTVSPNYVSPSRTLLAKYEYLPPFLDAVAYNTGMRISRALDGTINARSASGAQGDLEDNLGLATARSPSGGGVFVYDPSADPNDLDLMVPAHVAVVFPKIQCGLVTGDYDTPKTVSLTSLALTEFTGVTGTIGTKTFHDSCVADYTGGVGTPTNDTELTNLAKQLATDYYLWNRQLVDQKWDGIVAFDPEGFSAAYEWTYRRWPDEQSPRKHDVTSRIIPATFNDLAFDLFHASDDITIFHGSAILEKYGNIGFPGNLFFDKQRSWKPVDATVTLDQNDYLAPLEGPWLRINAQPSVTGYDWINITGFAGGNEGLVFYLTNNSSVSKPIKLQHESPLSVSINRLSLPGGVEHVIQPLDSVQIIYDCIAHRWYVKDMLSSKDDYDINVTTTLNGSINATVLALTVADHEQFPTDYRFKATIDSETMLIDVTSGSLTWMIVERAIDSTQPATHANGATVGWTLDTTNNVNQITVAKQGMAFPGGTTGGIRETIFPVTDQPVRIVSGPDGHGYYDAVRLKWNSVTKAWEDAEQIWLIDLDAP